jgi:multiple sugar transport system ATP-binding protein
MEALSYRLSSAEPAPNLDVSDRVSQPIPGTTFLRITGLEKTFADGTRAVKGIDLDIHEGELVVLLGPSGCGKTTTLRMVAGLEIATAGRIELGGTDVTTLRPSARDVGFVFQFYALYPHLTVRENIAFPLRSAGMRGAELATQIENVCRRVGLVGLEERYPRQLSGGDQQRVALARAMVRRPRIYLMDEPLGTLDADRRLEMCEFIRAQQLDLKVTTLYVTHDQEEAMSLADRIVVMADGEIRQIGSPAEVYETPRDLFVANFVGSPGMNFIEGTVEARGDVSVFVGHVRDLTIPLPTRTEAGPATLGIRPEYVRADDGGAIAGEVVLDEYLGSHRYIHVKTTFGRIVMRSQTSHAVGATARLALDLDALHVFDRASGQNRRHDHE